MVKYLLQDYSAIISLGFLKCLFGEYALPLCRRLYMGAVTVAGIDVVRQRPTEAEKGKSRKLGGLS